MLHLTGEPAEGHVLDEIHEYKKRLKQKITKKTMRNRNCC